jgi:hypothetical protein
MMNLKDRFRLTFIDLPLPERDKVAIVVEGKPLTWNVLRLEVEAGTKIAEESLEILSDLKLLKEK